MIIDEASLTGEADPIKKTPEDPWVRSGTQVGQAAFDHLHCCIHWKKALI